MEAISRLDLIIYGAAVFLSAILSGIAGAGGGFIMTPLLIFLGATPAQAVATGKLSGLSISLGSIGGMRSVPKSSKRRLIVIASLAFIIGLLAPLVIVRLESELYRNILGVLLLAMIPILIWKKVGHTEMHPTVTKKAIGYILLIVSLGLQAIFSGGLGTLVNLVLMAFLGMPALEANVTKRYSQVILNTVIVLGVVLTGLIIWPVAIIGIVMAGLGGFIGGKIAVKRGNTFVMSIFIVLMLFSALELLLG